MIYIISFIIFSAALYLAFVKTIAKRIQKDILTVYTVKLLAGLKDISFADEPELNQDQLWLHANKAFEILNKDVEYKSGVFTIKNEDLLDHLISIHRICISMVASQKNSRDFRNKYEIPTERPSDSQESNRINT